MTQSVYDKANDILISNNARFDGPIRKKKNAEEYICKVQISCPSGFEDTFAFVFDGTDRDFLETLQDCFMPYKDLDRNPEIFGELVIFCDRATLEDCGLMWAGVYFGIQRLLNGEQTEQKGETI